MSSSLLWDYLNKRKGEREVVALVRACCRPVPSVESASMVLVDEWPGRACRH